jgi:ribosomal protein S18 acetylase RimI-like enzyme
VTSAPAAFCRPLGEPDLPSARALARRAGVHGVYVTNSLESGEGCSDLVGFGDGGGELRGLGWYGARGNLIVLAEGIVDAEGVAAALRGRRTDWRICLGPAAVVARLAAAEPRRPLVDRDQVYYLLRPGEPRLERCRDDVRLATRHDVPALTAAALDLNASDLHVPPWRVHRGWLRDSVRRRIREGTTWVIGPVGAPVCKLDVGSAGPAGAVLEGVHTAVDARGQGLAASLVATVASRLFAEHALVCLHVAADNFAARRAYENAGMVEGGRCRILLRA